MTGILQAYVGVIDPFNRMIGRIVMYGIFVMMGILIWSSISKVFLVPSLWTLEMAQFAMVAYYILGGPYSIQMGSNVRMDLIYGEMSDRRKAAIDAVTVVFLLVYLGFLLYGGIASTAYSLGYFGSEPISFFAGLATGNAELGFLERSPTSWRPYLWPIKVIMVIGIFLMLLQVLCELAKDILRLKGHDMGAKV
ncbi:TRAP transporter small permease subunit [Marivita sp. XM-24bin2]|jgi:TRAP-type mannitol/chloroaromatic compound transport system permease small subunit|uniref:TRAP transporter small permease subunit n=1 Tax=unclassified Marivita TaxID=2632480 RepID=UPI000D79C7D3|nr:TRAP transporter small permease subunit [Marivita sp. XM-24bin2]MCR9109630.1 TRAP transporter small permease subunit [Paracoccaceae bacterium]PWL36177.1 MAG: C4-dicarboxylate ABC transporter [Marivita sp. XM-24bin2]